MRTPDRPWCARVRRALLDFWDRQRRALPWRQDRDAYRVWVSEIMLQQTRVETVIPYYNRWMARFPTLATVAAAPTEDVLLAWQGLGYYSRARNLHRAARQVMERFAGRLPDDAAALRRLPGIGQYTAGAIASIAFGQAEPAVDGNARRVLCRLLDRARPSSRQLHAAAAALVSGTRPGDLNQAIMELGATICTPRAPACEVCPVRGFCRAAHKGTQLVRPAPSRKRHVPHFDVGSAVIIAGARLLLVRRPDRGLLAGLWQFPASIPGSGESPRQAAIRAARDAGARFDARTARRLGTIPGVFTHRRETCHAFRIVLPDEQLESHPHEARWTRYDRLHTLPLPRAQQEIARLLQTDDG
ncbi:MAG: A/G-specific adenine glycosylase [Gemmatimonadetes bacterium]|nr:A/G-specific adenine glycosylase [Gemmatimonadota bacterium]